MDISFDEWRLRMVNNQLRTTDVTDNRILSAFLDVAREAFVPEEKRVIAYTDEDIEVSGAGTNRRYIIEASPFAKLLQIAMIGPDDVVLDVGCATGYSSAVISRLASSVIALECDEQLADKATETLSRLGYENVAVTRGPLEEGYAPEAPYDVIVIEGAVDFVPPTLLDQVKNGGRLVAVEGRGNAGFAKLYVKDQEGKVAGRRVFNAAVPALPGFRVAPAFQF